MRPSHLADYAAFGTPYFLRRQTVIHLERRAWNLKAAKATGDSNYHRLMVPLNGKLVTACEFSRLHVDQVPVSGYLVHKAGQYYSNLANQYNCLVVYPVRCHPFTDLRNTTARARIRVRAFHDSDATVCPIKRRPCSL